MSLARSGFAAAITLAFLGSAQAHDFVEGKGAHYKWNAARASHMPQDPVPAVQNRRGGPIAPFFVVVLGNRWAIGQTLHICFYGGSAALRTRIMGAAVTWLKYGNLHFDTGGSGGRTCSTNDTSEIRVGFNEPGYWSYIGTDSTSTDLTSKNLSSLNLQGFDTNPPAEPEFTGVVLHEFGHALGFHHEHQSPAEGCDKEYNWPKLYAYYQEQYGWNKQMVDANVRQLQANRYAYDWSQPDPLSIMVYASDPQFLMHGTASPCYFHENYVLSSLDEQGMTRTYPIGNTLSLLRDQAEVLEFLSKHTSASIAKILTQQLTLTNAQIQNSK